MGATQINPVGITPKLGDMVVYVMEDGVVEYPAMVIKILNYGCVDLQIMTHDGLLLKRSANLRGQRQPNTWHWPSQL